MKKEYKTCNRYKWLSERTTVVIRDGEHGEYGKKKRYLTDEGVEVMTYCKNCHIKNCPFFK